MPILDVDDEDYKPFKKIVVALAILKLLSIAFKIIFD